MRTVFSDKVNSGKHFDEMAYVFFSFRANIWILNSISKVFRSQHASHVVSIGLTRYLTFRRERILKLYVLFFKFYAYSDLLDKV